jgi:hypothetical protein
MWFNIDILKSYHTITKQVQIVGTSTLPIDSIPPVMLTVDTVVNAESSNPKYKIH